MPKQTKQMDCKYGLSSSASVNALVCPECCVHDAYRRPHKPGEDQKRSGRFSIRHSGFI